MSRHRPIWRLCFLLLVGTAATAGCAGRGRGLTPAPWLTRTSRAAKPLAAPQVVPLEQTVPVEQEAAVVRQQSAPLPAGAWQNEEAPGAGGQLRYPMVASGQPLGPGSAPTRMEASANRDAPIQLAQFNHPAVQQTAEQAWGNYASPPTASETPPPAGAYGRIPGTSVVPQVGRPTAPVRTAQAGPWQPLPTAPQQGSVGPAPPLGSGTGDSALLPAPAEGGELLPPADGPFISPGGVMGAPGSILGVPTPMTDIIVNLQETQTGRFMLGAAVNSDAGVTGQIVIDERNFDWRRPPTSWSDVLEGNAFRGAGQGLRIEALPGSQVQRYMAQFTEPYLFNTRISMNLSGYLFDRRYFDWDEERLGGRLGFGYRLTPDLSISATMRAEQVTIKDPRLPGASAQLDGVLGDHDLFSGRLAMVQDTRDIPFQPTQGYFLEFAFEQVFGSFDYSRGEIDLRRYFLLAERPDGSGRHVLGFSNRLGISGSATPMFENYFAGGYATLRGFDFRRASPQEGTVTVGGRLQFLGSVEYLFPITADDMLKGVAFCDYGTVEEQVEINADDYRVALGLGLRISIPAMGPAPIALDFAIPVAREDTDRIRQFNFFVGVSR